MSYNNVYFVCWTCVNDFGVENIHGSSTSRRVSDNEFDLMDNSNNVSCSSEY